MDPSRAVLPRRRRPKQSGASSDQYASKAISRALDVLDCLDLEDSSMSLRTIAMRIGLPDSTLFRILVTLEQRGYVEQMADGSYRLTPKVLFGRLYERAQRLRRMARPFLEDLVRRFEETASLAYLFDDKIQVLDTVESLHIIKFTNRLGRVLPPHASSLGKAITAMQPATKMDAILEAYGLIPRTEKTILDRCRLLAEYEQIRRQGYACDREETVPGGICFGAPIAEPGSGVVSAVSVSAPVHRLTADREQQIIAAVRACASAIAAAIDQAQSASERECKP